MTTHTILEGDVLDGLAELDDRCIQDTITSPPYYAVRDYEAPGQIGWEETPELYVESILKVTEEIKRVTAKDGVFYLNIGDSYAGSGCGPQGLTGCGNATERQGFTEKKLKKIPPGYKAKDMIGIPWMVAQAIRKSGWYLRSDIIWVKPNPMVHPVKDRCTSSHEHIFLFSKSAHYYYNAEAIREPSSESYQKDKRPVGVLRQKVNRKLKYPNTGQYRKQDLNGNPTYTGFNERWREGITSGKIDALTRNCHDVWYIPTANYPDHHFAAFPEEIPRRCILAGSRPEDIVLDPFMGRGTTAIVAKSLSRSSIGCELNHEYVLKIRQNLHADEQLDSGVGDMFSIKVVA